ncbi:MULTISPECIES: C-GCAxxG-C-C family (seleno)protein [Clostridium]|jgi:C_GCAxxG_C_C family probable redox protein|uniref:C_GCAxxG_C_C family protein n=1 Tax=Clostridium saccharoperbutylacetonicum N1-4(HMT) TaxID=931276 RepID=M1MRR8_9CLOT|nr:MULTISPECIES: C-GCAxxG-C-C family (seleno)protein [Clostridium]AGF54257.1 C_GCAxxG_C_C family protein [Clostridium saccharoperbutylacetonicum N1-4(HMT)]AQR93174.1 putative redox-active protein [Clostridium saccharoperbutylacetonicum]NRT59227.1 C_GCAxxG_C_C family probable redox protein [Clostridium saccharoperbutylacetonicum]NSB28416.1 C_GCAxxG_C_C family probable redox protein [Clostridium saccharoperbutylacetonicum]NSB34591.1 C_GCAxxG_C_C family probable redox protein [Clostridium sacchar
MLKEMVKKYREEKYDLNCAESIIYAANEEYDLNLSNETLKVMSGFGGGMGIGHICGVITASVGVIGVMFTEISGHKSPRVKEMTQEFINNLQDKLGYIKCDDLKKEYTNVKKCTLMIETGAEILEEIILKEKQNKIL